MNKTALLTGYLKLSELMKQDIDSFRKEFTERRIANNSSRRKVVDTYVTVLYLAGVICLDEQRELQSYAKAEKKYQDVDLSGPYMYWPCGKCNSESFPNLFTYNGVLSYEKALQQFTIWDKNIGITEAWIDVYAEGKKVAMLPVRKTWAATSERKGE